ncbi:malto-oligosyltrehalose synthase [Azoarcus indigens]|uniref:4-alpha-glucanotransferase n=1 Tax=Azoarcus indigens TaxID=29545 RepID=A0A4R6ECI3_9RHOO|nr:malto-oligosyltrehalose synthase [Azoarcus indigens]TDN55863.1 4-alpha-glucanotransferase/malto-oligosyltrehalose synthase,TIGR02401 [Azoarcus indigens]
MKGEAVDALCGFLGLDLAFEDAWGRRTEVPLSSRLALLAALGHPLGADGGGGDTPADSEALEARATAELARLRAEDASQLLPAMLVLEAAPPPLQLHPRLPAGLLGGRLWWRIRLEDGAERRGAAAVRAVESVGLEREHAAAREAGEAATAVEGPARLYQAEITLPVDLPQGYHRLFLYDSASSSQPLAEAGLAICPATCLPGAEPAAGGRLWGPAVQVYALRSSRDWGVGDFGDLRRLVDLAADAGAHFVGVNPLHALFPHDPERASPYSPSSREWLNVLYIDIEGMRDFAECAAAAELAGSAEFRARLDALRSRGEIDYRGVAAAKFEVLEMLYRHFRATHLERGTQRAGLFRDFQREGGRSLRLHALFDALQAHFHADDPMVWGWTTWPAEYRDPDSAAVEAFAQDNELRIEFFEYLQWQAEAQLHAVASRARARGMRIGLYRDLAVGVNEGGSETWARQSLHAFGAHAGAPPDELNPAGQDWGFPPQLPRQLAAEGYASFRAVLRANMRHAGALRIDHVMSLLRLFWLPAVRGADGQPPVGAYIGYPLEPLMRLLCLESRRHRCIVIGEDLGIVPPAIREAMARHGLLSYRPFYFEYSEGGQGFRRPGEWPAAALAVVGTHDLPTLRGYWRGYDLLLRDQLGIYPDTELRDRHIARRRADRHALLDALGAEGLLDADAERRSAEEGGDPPPALTPAVYRYIARSPALMAAVQLEDVLGQLAAVNLPGTSEEMQPNWRRRLSASLGELAADLRWHAVASAMKEERRSTPLPVSGGPADFHPEHADVPRATYRLQMHKDFGFAAAEAVLPYLADLGISHVYASPFLKARPGSSHGYDIVDHDAVNPEIGSEQDFDRYCERLEELGLGQVIDVVPNHVGVLGADNEWWLDVLENGPASAHADHFDIDWEPPFAELRGKVLLPVLGDQYGLVLENGELALAFAAERGEFYVEYYQHRFPIDPRDYPAILEAGAPAGAREEGGDGQQGDEVELETLLAALRHLPPREVEDAEALAERRRNKEVFKKLLADLYERLPGVRGRVEAALAAFRGTVGEPESFDALDALLSGQAYRLASWRVAADDINYRRFFDVNDLAALRMEHEAVFEATHARILHWVAEGRVSGLRIDHPDGLADPAAYFDRLQARYADAARDARITPWNAVSLSAEETLDGPEASCRSRADRSASARAAAQAALRDGQHAEAGTFLRAPVSPEGLVQGAEPVSTPGTDLGAAASGLATPFPPPASAGGKEQAARPAVTDEHRTLYLVVEKILAEFEVLPADWRIHGGTGYRFANLSNNLFVDPVQESRFNRIYRAFTGESRNFSEVLLEAKHIIMTHSLPGELGTLAYLLHAIAQRDRRTRDFTRSRLRGALVEVIAAFPVYRSYISERGVSAADRRHIERAVEEAAARGLAGDASVLRFVRDVLLSAPTEQDAALRRLKLRFVRRFQQFTAPVMAKAMEDTAFYRYNRLVSLNDVGGDPRTFGVGVEDFHIANERIACSHPFGLLASSTHDSKRSEDVRARIDVLSELPGAWRLALRRWRRLNERRKTRVGDQAAPSANDEYLFYQTLLGIWPWQPPAAAEKAELVERVQAYMLKAVREAKRHTSWMNPEPAYEAALATFVRRTLADEAGFLADFQPFQAVLARYGAYNSLSMLLLKLTAPGVPDIYQGCEGWNFSLVDPDNRRPVDFDAARERLSGLQRDFPDGADAAGLAGMLENLADGRLKHYLLWRALAVRESCERTLRCGRYVPLDVRGPAARHVVAFARVLGRETVVVIATRLLFGLTGGNEARICDPATWAGTLVSMPWRREGMGWRDAIAGRRIPPRPQGPAALPVAEVFGPLPLALLVRDNGGEA